MLERQVTSLVLEPSRETYHGHVRTLQDAIVVLEACRIGLLPRVQRRLSGKERQSIGSGSIFVWDEEEAGMRRWTDGKTWSASRAHGSFLIYREMEGNRRGSSLAAPLFPSNKSKENSDGNTDGVKDAQLDLVEIGPDGYRCKPDGLLKQSFRITISSGEHLHLVSYFSRSVTASTNLMQPSNDPRLRHIRPKKGMYHGSFTQDQNHILAVTRRLTIGPGTTTHSPPHATARSPFSRSPPHATQHPSRGSPPGWTPPSPMHTPPLHHYPAHYLQTNQKGPPSHLEESSFTPIRSANPLYSQGWTAHSPKPTASDSVCVPLVYSGHPPPAPQPYHHILPASQAPAYNYPPLPVSCPSAPPPARLSLLHTQQLPRLNQMKNNSISDPALSSEDLSKHDSVHTPAQRGVSAEASQNGRRTSLTTSSCPTVPSISFLIHSAEAAALERATRTTVLAPTATITKHNILGFNPKSDTRALKV